MVFTVKKILKIFQRTDSIFNNEVRKQLLVSLLVNIISFSHGIALGWSAPTLKILTTDETPLSFKISFVEASWIASLIGLGSMLGNLIFCNLLDVIGRKACLLLIALPNICLWVLVYAAQSVEYLFIARFIGGLTGGSCFSVILLFINEIANARQRGALQSFSISATNFGILIGYILSSKLSYHLVPCTVIALPIAYLLTVLCFPETPHFLLKRGHDQRALESLRFYKNYHEITPKCEEELHELKEAIVKSKAESKLSFKDFVTKPALKAYGIILVLFIMNQFSGIYAFLTYMSDIFSQSGSPFEPNTCTIIMGVVQVIGNFTTIFFIDHFGRKALIVVSAVGVILGVSGFGCFTYMKDIIDLALYSWIPLVLMIFIIFLANIGVVSVFNISAVEVLPVKIRSTALSVVVALLSLFIFTALKIFPILMHTLGISITMWCCAGITTVCLILLIIFLPETKGKSMEVD